MNRDRLIAGTEDEEQKEDQACFWFCSSKRAIMTSTNRQELRDFTFSTNSQIGLEVEAMDEKVRCCSFLGTVRTVEVLFASLFFGLCQL